MAIVNVQFLPVMTKARKRMGNVYPSTHTEFEYAIERTSDTNEYFIAIRMKQQSDDGYRYTKPKVFRIGDTAEYDSYNLSYMGTIKSITSTTVTIVPKYRDKAKRLNIHEFSWRNYDFDVAKKSAENTETSMYI